MIDIYRVELDEASCGEGIANIDGKDTSFEIQEGSVTDILVDQMENESDEDFEDRKTELIADTSDALGKFIDNAVKEDIPEITGLKLDGDEIYFQGRFNGDLEMDFDGTYNIENDQFHANYPGIVDSYTEIRETQAPYRVEYPMQDAIREEVEETVDNELDHMQITEWDVDRIKGDTFSISGYARGDMLSSDFGADFNMKTNEISFSFGNDAINERIQNEAYGCCDAVKEDIEIKNARDTLKKYDIDI